MQIAGLEGVMPPTSAGIQLAGAQARRRLLQRMAKIRSGRDRRIFDADHSILDQAMKSGGRDRSHGGLPVPTIAAGALLVALVLTPLFWLVRS